MVPCVYFFFPETAYRSLEEMDEIFHKVHGFKGIFDVVRVAKEMPHRYGKHGEQLIAYDETEEAHEVARRRSSVVGQDSVSDAEKAIFGGGTMNGDSVERKENADGK